MTPWHFVRTFPNGYTVDEPFVREDVHSRKVVLLAYRQDCDDRAGCLIENRKITDKILVYHPSFTTNPRQQKSEGWDIVEAIYDDFFAFVGDRVCSDMRDWALTEDANELELRPTR